MSVMAAGSFIAHKLRFKERLSAGAIAISFFIMIVAVAISAGFREEIRSGVSDVSGDILLSASGFSYYGEDESISENQSYLPEIMAYPGVEEIKPAVYRAGIVRNGQDIAGVVFKGVESSDSTLHARVPDHLATQLGLRKGDRMLSYFIGSKVKMRNFTVEEVYDSLLDTDDAQIVYVPISDMQRLNDWDENEVSSLEITLDKRHNTREGIREATAAIGSICSLSAGPDDDIPIAQASTERFSTLFDWLDLIDFNVSAILILMTIVAGFNMISGLLIMLLRNTSTIGTLKAMGMTSRGIAGVFLRVSARIVLKGLLVGNAAALLFCLIQGTTHLIRLNPANYFVSFVPVSVNVPGVILADILAFAAIMLLLALPSVFISKVDPAQTMRSE